MSAKREANQMGVVVDVPELQVDGLDEQGHLVVENKVCLNLSVSNVTCLPTSLVLTAALT